MTSPTVLDGAGLPWRTSSYSSPNGSDCVEVAPDADADVIAVRDSKNRTGPKLAFDASTWEAFTRRVKVGDVDL